MKLTMWRVVVVLNMHTKFREKQSASSFLNSIVAIYYTIQLFRERLSEKMCTRQSRKVIWDMINTPVFLTLQLSNLLLLPTFSTRRHMSTASPAILSNFFEKQCPQNNPQYLSGLPRALYPTTFLEVAVYYILVKSNQWSIINAAF